MTTIYGIKNCDTVKKSLKWLEKNNIEFSFHDFRVDGLTPELLTSLVNRSSWDVLLNKRSTTFRNLPSEIKDNLTDDVIFNAVIEQPTLLKRPILIKNDITCVGFKDDLYQENLL
ncbi:Spx/MgsR family RNA polymerase-binding regulatory protein [Pseudocolwellia agarivorans]|uniref:Spx/MgsR family RNA polymerase-binding regulatory protein n=1 Tax=Pseudocolwellia agarivorans TaxID=1911682 RepID=UPI0009866898|nr:Spx/MgsR family RNA polymerase-binding regulatory protein [Pseudocolwellia agarivorans]